MKAIIVAAGRGSRLSPVTDTIPKCLIDFAGHRLIDWQIAALQANGISDINVVRGYLSHRMEGLGIRKWDNPRWAETNMVYSFLSARSVMTDADEIIAVYGDIVFEPRLAEALVSAPGDIATVVDLDWSALWQERLGDPLSDAESLRMDDEWRLTDIGRDVSAVDDIQARYVGLTRFSRTGMRAFIDLYDRAEAEARDISGHAPAVCYMTDMLQALIESGQEVFAAPVRGGWLEFDSVSDLQLYRQLCDAGTIDRFFQPDLVPV